MVKGQSGHYVKPNRGTARPRRHLFFDIESELVEVDASVTEHQLQMGWSCYWRRRDIPGGDTLEYEFWTTGDEFLDIIEKHTMNRSPLVLVAHNVAYDAGVLGLLDQLHDRGWTMTAFYATGMTVIIQLVNGARKIKIIDNGNFFKSSLAALGDAVNLPKLDIDFDVSPWNEMKAYCKRDVEIMVTAWKQYYAFLDLHDFGQWGHTVPSQAWNAWRHRFMPHQVLIHGNDEAYKLERAAYHGGRTSVFYKGVKTGEEFYYLDVNSMYPAMMQKYPYPTVLKWVKPFASMQELIDALWQFAVIAEVEIETDEPVFVATYNHRNIYPVGRFWTTLTTPELQYALEQGMIRDVKGMAVYEQQMIFSEYVDYLYPLKVQYKQEDNKPYYLMTKLFLNSLYGRFGMKGHKWTKLDDPDTQFDDVFSFIDTATGVKSKVYHYAGDTWLCEETGETSNSAPAVAAHVTAYARLYLWELCKMAGKRHYLYCDTDSIIVDHAGYAQLAHLRYETTLGMLKLEQVSHTVEIQAPKFYRFGDDWKRKGVSKSAIEIDPATFQMDTFPSFLTQGQWSRDQKFTTRKVTKRFALTITDGTVGPDGWVDPLKAEDLDRWYLGSEVLPIEALMLQVELRELTSMRLVPQTVMLQLWDYTSGTFKQARNGHGELGPLIYSKWDGLAADLGFPDVTFLMKGVERQIRIDQDIRNLKYQIGCAVSDTS